MSQSDLEQLLNPETTLTGGITIVDAVAVAVAPGTPAPPRPPGRERIPSSKPLVIEPIVIFESKSIAIPPGTIAPPRKPSPDV
jgi:hypothetical protein